MYILPHVSCAAAVRAQPCRAAARLKRRCLRRLLQLAQGRALLRRVFLRAEQLWGQDDAQRHTAMYVVGQGKRERGLGRGWSGRVGGMQVAESGWSGRWRLGCSLCPTGPTLRAASVAWPACANPWQARTQCGTGRSPAQMCMHCTRPKLTCPPPATHAGMATTSPPSGTHSAACRHTPCTASSGGTSASASRPPTPSAAHAC